MPKRRIGFLTIFLLGTVFVAGALAFSKDTLVWQKCTSCHEPVAGKIPRVEEIRTSPEEWAVIVDRMVRLYGLELQGGELNSLVKELTATQGLTAAEAGKIAYLDLYNNPQNVEVPGPDDPEKLFVTCVRCHSAGKIYSYRMTETAWAKVRDFHLYMIPTVIPIMREMKWIPEADAVLAQLAKSQPYGQPLKVDKVRLAESWLILGYEPGKGNYRGQAHLKNLGNDEYLLSGALQYDDLSQETFRGDATLYSGTALRSNTLHNGQTTQGAFRLVDGVLIGQHHFPAPDFRTSASHWYAENSKTQVLKISPSYLLSGEKTTLVIEGTQLPQISPADVKVGAAGVKIHGAKQLNNNRIEVQVTYTGQAREQATLKIKGLDAGTLNLVTQIDYIAISPELGRARVHGGNNFPAEAVQYEALAYAKGSKGDKPDADILLGAVPAVFHLSELVTRPKDDDLTWLGRIESDGTYIPSSDYGPLASREFHTEGTGLVKVNAEYKRGEHRYTAEARLVVTVPDYIPRIK